MSFLSCYGYLDMDADVRVESLRSPPADSEALQAELRFGNNETRPAVLVDGFLSTEASHANHPSVQQHQFSQ
jgi:hypothetical protein